MELLRNRRIYGAVKLLTIEQIGVLQAKAERFRDDARMHHLGKRLIQLKRARLVAKPA